MIERAVLFGKSKNLVGVLTQTSSNDFASNFPAVILLNAGLVHHVGPNRINVQLARRLAASGYPTLRFDLSGIGDSGNRTDNLPLRDGVLHDVKQAMDLLAGEQGVRQFILTGICSGANNCLRVALSDDRIIGIAPIEPYFFATRGYHFYFYRKRLFQLAGWRRLITMKSDVWRRIKKHMMRKEVPPALNAWSGQEDSERGGDYKSQIVSEIQHLLSRGIRLHFLYCVNSPSYYNHYLTIKPKFEPGKQFRITLFPNADHIFTLLSMQKSLIDSIHDWVQVSFSHEAVAPVMGDAKG